MARPPAEELTGRELEVMHAFWGRGGGDSTAAEVRDALADGGGPDLAYTTVATLIRILMNKGFLAQTGADRPFTYRPSRSYEDVSRRLLGETLERVFRGSREQLIVRLVEQRGLTAAERDLLRGLLDEPESGVPGGKKGGRP